MSGKFRMETVRIASEEMLVKIGSKENLYWLLIVDHLLVTEITLHNENLFIMHL